MTDILVITGLSGAGRSQAADDLEDLGWFVVDNLPVVLVDKVVELSGESGGAIDQLCLVVGNVRQQTSVLASLESLRKAGHRVRLMFLEASTRELVSRYEATRRKHPFVEEGLGLEALIERERTILEEVRAAADLVIDTTGLNVHQLKSKLVELFGPTSSQDVLQVTVTSFGFKYGLPLDVDMVLDVRFLPNPHWDERLRPMTGVDEPVREYVMSQPATTEFLQRTLSLLELVLPAYVQEGRSYFT
ncbi:MAG: RNase adapter RapZ, partial [Planctomycetes bacterium]|nr:RNase adapter RapZ [Planctomycetota bacterium]